MVKEHLLVPLFETFIKETANGHRRKLNGEKIKPQTIMAYRITLKTIIEYQAFSGQLLSIKTNIRNNEKLIKQERYYWKTFYRKFSDFIYEEKNCFDNYAGLLFKNIKSFFRYLRNDKFLALYECYESFYVRKEDIRVISLLPEHFCFLIMDKNFESRLSRRLQRIKDMFVFGCTAALRFSDLTNLRVKDVEFREGKYFLHFNSVKTGTELNLKLPEFAITIFNKYCRYKTLRGKLFPRTSLMNFNKSIRQIGELAGWNESIGKYRTRNGEIIEIQKKDKGLFRFCDQLSSHVMRKTGITVLLMLDMPEYLVRKISGHTSGSKSFYRYVNFAQSYITKEIDKVHEKLLLLYKGGELNYDA